MVMRRIFISHKANETETDKFLKDLSAKLKEDPAFDVLIDTERLKEGQKWRNEIYTWMGLCHCAIILLSKKAIEDSIWVPRESNNLVWRKELEPSFVLIPIYLKTKPDEVKQKSFFKDLNLEEYHGPVLESDKEMIEGIEKIKQRLLSELKPNSILTPLERVTVEIASYLKNVSDEHIEEASERLEVELGPWAPKDNKRHTLALKMLQVGVRKSTKAMKVLARRIPGDIDRIFDLLKPSWVDLCAARWVSHCVTMEHKPKRAIVLNAKRSHTAEMYVRRAGSCCQPPEFDWTVCRYDCKFGAGGADEIERDIMKSLILQFQIHPTDDKEQLMRVLEVCNEDREPVYLIIKYSKEIASFLPNIQKNLGLITMFLIGSDNLPPEKELEDLYYKYLPPLQFGKEQDAIDDCYYAQKQINQTKKFRSY